jgi:hypothetical protein
MRVSMFPGVLGMDVARDMSRMAFRGPEVRLNSCGNLPDSKTFDCHSPSERVDFLHNNM